MWSLFFVLSALVCLAWPAHAAASNWGDCNQAKDPDRGIRGCTRIIDSGTRKDREIAFLNRGRSYSIRQSPDLDSALADFDEAIRLKPGFSLAYRNRGLVQLIMRNYDRAIADCSQATSLNPKDADAYGCLAIVYTRKTEYDRAIAAADASVRLEPSKKGERYFVRGYAYFEKGEYDHAIADFDRASRINPKLGEAYLGRGQAFDKQGHHDRAIAEYDRAIAAFDQGIRLNPKDASAISNRGASYVLRGDNDRGIADLDEALRLAPNDPDAYHSRGWGYDQKGDLTRAVADYDQALRIDPYIQEARDRRSNAVARVNGRPPAPEAPATTAALASPALRPEPAPASRPVMPMGRRVALVIGNGSYGSVGRLPNPARDAAAIAAQLKQLGFEVIDRYDLDMRAMRGALREFESKVAGADWALVYYAGHGMEMDGRNWLVPVDASLDRATDVPDEAVDLERVLERVREARRLRIVILDACRNNPFLSRMVMTGSRTRSVQRGLADIEPDHGEVVFYAARHGTTADDGASEHSPFTTALLRRLAEEGLEMGLFFRKVTSDVLAATTPKQQPFLYGSIPADSFYFIPPKGP